MEERKSVIVVSWRDPVFSLDEIPQQLSRMFTTGWIVEEDDESIVVASEYDSTSKDYRQLTRIPRVLIKEIIKLEERSDE